MAAACLTAGLTVAAEPAVPTTSAVTATTGPRTTTGGNPTHDNVVPSALRLPLQRSWVRDFGLFYADWMPSGVRPLAAEGRVYVRDRGRLYAFDEDTGAPAWAPVPVGFTFAYGGMAYDSGRLFLGTKEGVDAYDASDGSLLWRGVAGAVDSGPTAIDGVVYYSSTQDYGSVIAVDQIDGHVHWRTKIRGLSSPPAVQGDTVYASFACNQDYAFDRRTGAIRWHNDAPCAGGGGNIPVVRGNRVWMDRLVLDTATGADVSSPSSRHPSFWEGLMLGLEPQGEGARAIVARDASTGVVRWSFTGDGSLATQPLVSNGVAYVASMPGGVWALDPGTGAVLWDDHVHEPLAASSYVPDWGLTVADHHLVLAAGSSIHTWKAQEPPAGVVPPPPRISKVDPESGPSSGMNTVCITGEGFTGVTRVRIGNADALSFVVRSDTLIEAVVLPQDIGGDPYPYPHDIVVTGPGGPSAVGPDTKYAHNLVPQVHELLARHGPPIGGTHFAMRGIRFSGVVKVLVGGLPAVFFVESDTWMRVVTPPGLPGPAPVQLVAAAGTTADLLHSRFHYDHPPSVTSLTPNRGPSDGGTSVRVTGSGFTGPSSVFFGTRWPRADSIVDDGTMFVTTNYNPPGTVNMTVSNQSGRSLDTDDNEFTFEAPPPTTTTTRPMTTTTTTTTSPPPSSSSQATASSGYRMVSDDGRVYAFGDAGHHGDAAIAAGSRAVHIESSPTGKGYWVADDRGGVHAFGDAVRRGGNPALQAGESVASLSATVDGGGYWLFTTTGRALPYGNAVSYGDMSGRSLNGPVRRSTRSDAGRGYYMVAADGGVFSYGDAAYRGSMGGRPLNGPVVGLAPKPGGGGYWLVADDGGIFAFDAPFKGSMGGRPLNRPVVGMVAYGDGYLMVAADGGIFNFSTKPFHGSLGASPPPRPIVAVAALSG